MCITIPSRVLATDGTTATVERCGERLRVSLLTLPDPVKPGDFVTLRARTHAVAKVSKDEARAALELLRRWMPQPPTGGATEPAGQERAT